MKGLKMGILKQFADGSNICHKPQRDEGDAASLSTWEGWLGSTQLLPLDREPQETHAESEPRATVPLTPDALVLRMERNTILPRAPGLNCFGYELPLSLESRVSGLWRWLRKRCFQRIRHRNWEPREKVLLCWSSPDVHYKMGIWLTNSPQKSTSELLPKYIHGPDPPTFTFCLFSFMVVPCHIKLNFILFLKAMLVYHVLSSSLYLGRSCSHLFPCTTTMIQPSTCHIFRKVLPGKMGSAGLLLSPGYSRTYFWQNLWHRIAIIY